MAVLGLMHTDANKYAEERERGGLVRHSDTDVRSLIKSSLQDALEREGDKLEALA